MTHNMIAWQNAIETARANRARETEQSRHNLVEEKETARSNAMRESESRRHNRADEGVSLLEVNERVRNNARLYDMERIRQAEQTRHNKVAEYWNSYGAREISRSNVAREELARRDQAVRAAENLREYQLRRRSTDVKTKDSDAYRRDLRVRQVISAYQARTQRLQQRAQEHLGRVNAATSILGSGLKVAGTLASLIF